MATTPRSRRRPSSGGRRNGRRSTKGGDAAASLRAPAASAEPAQAIGDGAREPGAAASLDVLMSDAVLGSGSRVLPGWAAVKLAGKVAGHPRRSVGRGLGLAAELARIALGRSETAPSEKDKRFKDPAWEGNFAFRRLCQAYLAAGKTVDDLISDADLDWRSERRVRFAAENVLDALAPTNFALTNPTVLKATIDTGGANFWRGLKNFRRDMRHAPRVPSMVDESKFELGENIGVSPGAVVLRTPVCELIQYQPSTEKVRGRPLLIVPPQINRFYVVDMAPGRSMVEHWVGRGQQVFVLSWRNPDERHADWNFDTYVESVLEGLDAVEAITGTDATHVLGLCAGGATASIAVAHLAARGEGGRIAGLALGVTVIDNEHAGTTGAFVDRTTAAIALAESARKGYMSGKALAGVFAWLRPNDLIWGYVVNNYLLGKDPPAFDVLFWNADTTRMPAGLHRDFMRLGLDNPLVRPGELSVLGTPIDLGKITADTYMVAGIGDHISPWQDAYRTVHLMGSKPRFVLSNAGHIAAMVNPPSEKASFYANRRNRASAEAWLGEASQQRGTWWDDFSDWLGERSGDERPAPRKLGGPGYEPVADAPGTYVLT
ncbi:MAG: PHA/PHB synthase family protein [Thermoleophilaceae bacterium]